MRLTRALLSGPSQSATTWRGRRLAAVTVGAAGAMLLLFAAAGGASATGLTVTYQKSAVWSSGYMGTYRIHNISDRMIEGWTLEFELPEGNIVTTLWGGVLVRHGNRYTVSCEAWNSRLMPNETVTIDFEVAVSGRAAGPVRCRISGRPVAA